MNTVSLENDAFSYPPEEGLLGFGASSVTANIGHDDLTVFTYRPPDIVSPSGILFLFDGLNRDASGMRDKAMLLARRVGLIVFAPLMQRDRFPKWRYHAAGVVRHGRTQPRAQWTALLF